MTTAVSTPITGNKQNRRAADEWRALIRAFSRSSETRTQFCEHQGLALSTFDRWRSLLRQESPARAVPNTVLPGALFVEIAEEDKPVTTVSEGWDVELELGAGLFLRLRRGRC
ncbi:MAG: IS66 family insertion sequence element accessory protein TnpA [Acidiferrobacterales bacterium]